MNQLVDNNNGPPKKKLKNKLFLKKLNFFNKLIKYFYYSLNYLLINPTIIF